MFISILNANVYVVGIAIICGVVINHIFYFTCVVTVVVCGNKFIIIYVVKFNIVCGVRFTIVYFIGVGNVETASAYCIILFVYIIIFVIVVDVVKFIIILYIVVTAIRFNYVITFFYQFLRYHY